MGALGLATDTARGYLVKARLSQALDAAALAGGKVYFSTQRDADIKKYFAANFPSASAPVYNAPYTATFMNAKVTLNAPVNGGVSGKENLTLKAEATIPTTFMRVLGFDDGDRRRELAGHARHQRARRRALARHVRLDGEPAAHKITRGARRGRHLRGRGLRRPMRRARRSSPSTARPTTC